MYPETDRGETLFRFLRPGRFLCLGALFLTFLSGLAASVLPAAGEEGGLSIAQVLPDDPERGTKLEAVLVVRDLRAFAAEREAYRERLMKTAAGASFLSAEAQKRIFGYDGLAELKLLVDLADPSGGPVPFGIALYSEGPEVRGQALLRTTAGFLDRLGKAFAGTSPPSWPGAVEGDTLMIGPAGKSVVGRVGGDGWLRVGPTEEHLGEYVNSAPLLEGAAAKWSADSGIILLLRGGGPLAQTIAMQSGDETVAGIIAGVEQVVLAFASGEDGTAAVRLLVDSPVIAQFAPMVRPPVLGNAFTDLWEREAAEYLSLSVPPLFLAGLSPLLLAQLQEAGTPAPAAVAEAVMKFSGRISLAGFGTPGDWAAGLQFQDEATAAALVPALKEWLDGLTGEEVESLIHSLALESIGEGKAAGLQFGLNSGLGGLAVTAIGPAVVVTRQASRRNDLVARVQPPAERAAAPMMKTALDAPSLLSTYKVLGDDNTIFGDPGWAALLFREAFRKEIGSEPLLAFLAPYVEYAPTLVKIAQGAMSMTYDTALWGDIDGGTLVLQVLSSELPAGGAYLEAVNKRLDGDSRGYFDGLIALAHSSPESREGRRARATLTSNPFNQFTTIGILAAIAIPNFIEYREKAAKAATGESPPEEPPAQ